MKAIIFDCDGTLVDSEVLGNEVLVESVAEHGLAIPLPEALHLFRGRKLAECVAEIEQRLGRSLPQDFVTQFRSRMADAFRQRLQPVNGALELVKSLRQRFCVASSGPRAKIELSLSLTGLLPFFRNSIFSSYEVGVWKPDPGLFLHAARAMGVASENCVVVEDSLPGSQAGIAAGMHVFAFQPHETDLRIPSNVDVIRHLSELKSRLIGDAAEQRSAADEDLASLGLRLR
jgi:HAD superfamily hydrolase (TIGR01509 family)